MKKLPPLISVARLTEVMNRPDTVLVDARGGPDADKRFLAGHLAGAVRVDLETELSEKSNDPSKGGRHPLPSPKKFGLLLGRLGITPASHVIVYDDRSGTNAAARFWWMMRAAGHHQVQVVDGDFEALQRDLPLAKGSGSARVPAGSYPVDKWILPTATMEWIDHARKQKEALVIDVREAYRYHGESEPIDLVAGHIPGAINLPFPGNLAPDARFKPAAELKSQLSKVVGDRDIHHVAVHCGSGVTACHTILAFEAAGLPLPALYVGSWSEWSRNDKPVGKKHSGQGS